MRFSFLIFCFLLSSILSLKSEKIEQIEVGQELEFIMNSKTIYIATKNTLNGVLIYDVYSTKNLNLTFAKFDSLESPLKLEDFEGHNETTKNISDCLTSISVNVKNDEKYTFLKIDNLDYDSQIISIKVKLSSDQTWTLVIIVLGLFTFIFIVIFLVCLLAKKYLMDCCNFKD